MPKRHKLSGDWRRLCRELHDMYSEVNKDNLHVTPFEANDLILCITRM